MGNTAETHPNDASDHGEKRVPSISETEVSTEAERDERALARLGKKPILKRRFGFFSMLGFTCTILITWEAELIVFTLGLTKAPTSGGQYHWASMLAPPSCKKFISYIMGTERPSRVQPLTDEE
ncbi:MAG: hypothetical protein Q9222_004290 [Ikaeria aurantiellina]